MNIDQASPRSWCVRGLIVICALLVAAAPALAQTTASLKQWDIFAATGGDGSATQNFPTIFLDATGIAGPIGSVWFTAQTPTARLGRIDPGSATDNYAEWSVFAANESGIPSGLALNPANGELWLAIQGDPSLVMKLPGGNTFKRFRASSPLVAQGIAIAADGSAVLALPGRNMAGIGRMIARVPRPTGDTVRASYWDVGGEPRFVAIDGSGAIWYTNHATNQLGRLNTSTGSATEWTLPSGRSPRGLHVAGSTVCVVSEGLNGTLSGTVYCLEAFTNTVTEFVRPPGAGLDFPQQVAANTDGELFITEQNGNAVTFVSDAARGSVTTTVVTPAVRTVATGNFDLTVTEMTVAPLVRTVTPSVTTLTGSDNGFGQIRFALPIPALTYPFALTGYPQPVGITRVSNDVGRGSGRVYVAESFNGPLYGRFAAGRIDEITLSSPSIETAIVVNPTSMQFTATAGSAAPGSQTVAITEYNGGALSWTAAKSASWLTLGSASGTAPSSLSVSVNQAGLSPGSYADTITVDDGPNGAAARTIAVTLVVSGQPTIAVAPAALTFYASLGLPSPPTQAFAITNSGSSTLDWTATASDSWMLLSQTSGTAPSMLSITIAVPSSSGTRSGTVTITSANASNPSVTVKVVLNVSKDPPKLSSSAASLVFTAARGASAPAAQTLTISNIGGGTASWTATPSEAWLQVSPRQGATQQGAGSGLSIAVDHSTLARGTYTANITVTDPFAANSPLTVPVTLTVTAPALAVNPSTLTFTSEQGGTPSSQSVVVSNTGDGPSTFTPQVTSTGGSWLSVLPAGAITVNPGSNATLTVSASTASLSPGSYTGSIVISDAATATTHTVSVTLTITASAVLAVTPAAVGVTAIKGGAAPATQTVNVANTGASPLTYTAAVTSNSPWLLIASGGSGSVEAGTAATVSLEFNIGGLAKGTYTGTVQVSAPNVANAPQNVTVTLTIQAATIDVNPGALTFSTLVGTTPATQQIVVSNSGNAPLNFTAAPSTTSGGAWLSVTPSTDTVPAGGSRTVTVSASSAALAAGAYSGAIAISDPQATNARQVGVALTVAQPAMIALSPSTLSFSAGRLVVCNGVTSGATPAAKTITVTNTGAGAMTFNASAAGAAWLSISPATGTLAPGASAVLSATVSLANLSAGAYSASVQVTGAPASNSPQTVPVTLTVGAAPATLCVTPMLIDFGGLKGKRTSAPQTFTVTNVGDLPMGAWSATRTASSGTINMSVTSGIAPTTVSVSVTASTKRGVQSGTITVSAAGVAGSPRVITVKWTVP